MEYGYQVFDPSGRLIMEASAKLRYSPRVELDMLEAGYTIKLNGKKLTKTEIRKEAGRK